jgi:hypothetical protein
MLEAMGCHSAGPSERLTAHGVLAGTGDDSVQVGRVASASNKSDANNDVYTDDEDSVAQSPRQQLTGTSVGDARPNTSSSSRQRADSSHGGGRSAGATPYRRSSGGMGDPRKMRPPSPYLSALPNYDARPTSSSVTPVSRTMGRPQSQTSGNSFVLSSVDAAWSARRRPPSVSSQLSDEPRRLLDAKVSRKRSEQDYQLMVRGAKPTP